MKDIVVMHVFHSIANLLQNVSDPVLGKAASTPQLAIQVALTAQLCQQIQDSFLDKSRIKLNDVRVIQVALNLDLSDVLEESSRVGAEQSLGNRL